MAAAGGFRFQGAISAPCEAWLMKCGCKLGFLFLGFPVVPFLTLFWGRGRTKGNLSLSSLEDLVSLSTINRHTKIHH